MAYTTRAEIEAMIPPRELARVLDDNRDQAEDSGLFAACQALADQEVEALVSPAVAVPIASPPAMIRHGARVLLARLLYERAGRGERENPYTDPAEAVREQLGAVGRGEAALSGSAARASFTSHDLLFAEGG